MNAVNDLHVVLLYSVAAKNTEMYVVKDLWCSSTVWPLKNTNTSAVKDLWCSSTVWLLKNTKLMQVW